MNKSLKPSLLRLLQLPWRHSSLTSRLAPATALLFTSSQHRQEIKLSDENIGSFLNGSSLTFIEEIHQDWVNNSSLVDASWDAYFKAQNAPQIKKKKLPTTTAITNSQVVSDLSTTQLSSSSSLYKSKVDEMSDPFEKLIEDHLKLYALIRSYQMRGHRRAALDPLGRAWNEGRTVDLTPQFFHFTDEDLGREFRLPATTFIGGGEQKLTLREILDRLNRVYCDSIGLEYMFINNRERVNWLRQSFETPDVGALTNEEKRLTLRRLMRATRFEEFLAKKWSSEKRFGLEGCEVLVPAMHAIIDTVSAKGVNAIFMALAHRGRLNCLANVIEKPLEKIFYEFDSKYVPTDKISGDVKYHMGINNEITSEVRDFFKSILKCC
jgi:2-oxoglutarate dehydrogenase E1 component